MRLMTVVPLPASPCVRVRLDYQSPAGTLAGSRFFLSYAGSSPTPSNLNTLAGDIATTWESSIANLTTTDWELTEIDILDIATETGASGTWAGSKLGLLSSPALPDQVASNVEYVIARRYRGGKPRMYIPPANSAQLQNNNQYTSAFAGDLATQVSGFMSDIAALSIGAMGALAHVNLSYYKGFTNITNSSGRERAVPTYRAAASVDAVTGYKGKQLLSSQRRRRTAVTY